MSDVRAYPDHDDATRVETDILAAVLSMTQLQSLSLESAFKCAYTAPWMGRDDSWAGGRCAAVEALRFTPEHRLR